MLYPEQINLIVQRLNHIHTDLTDLILQNQNLRFQQYEIISRDRQSMVSLFTEVFLLFLIIIGIMIYLTSEFIRERQDMYLFTISPVRVSSTRYE